ncbi:dTDP-4-dehydrorhamnose 3,5-epimerase [Micromonospora sp. NPDC048999]|uniref:dTDP-4-dehydrorhamnose 3,5-epimerase family protein n=1 Tax=Micromonospora sp. NPDC048999 TaxID=3155391 RepID=UPI0033E07214
MKPLGIAGAWTRDTRVFRDARGSFRDWYQGGEISADVGRDFVMRQANCVVSHRGVMRGIHYTQVPPGTAKYFTCVRGTLLSAVVDVRVGSPTFGQWRTVELNAADGQALYVAEGLAHGFLSLDDSVLVYACSTTFNPRHEHGINMLDPELGIDWPAGVSPELSEKDSVAPNLAEAERLGLLPRWVDCPDGQA